MLTSCGDINEVITMEVDGSGKFSTTSDAVPMMKKMMKPMASMLMASEDIPSEDSVALDALITEEIWKQIGEESLDSIIDMKASMSAEMKEDREMMDVVERSTFFMRGSREEGKMLTGMEYTFNTPEQLELLYSIMDRDDSVSLKKGPIPMPVNILEVSKKRFYRKSIYPEKPDDSDTSAAGKFSNSINKLALLGNIKMTSTLNFARKIKRVKVEGYEVLEQTDHKIVLVYTLGEDYYGKTLMVDVKLK